jgi:hypothetical protein
MSKPLDKLASEDFLPLLNQKFVVRLDGAEPIELELVQITELGAAHSPEQRKPFSVLFLGPVSQLYLLQSTYRLEHEQLGALELFIVPVGPQQGRMEYQAIFN